MEDKLLNRIINQHLKNLAVTRNNSKHITNTNDNIGSITTASISRETSDVQLRKEQIMTTVTSFNKQPMSVKWKQPSKSQDKVVDNRNQENKYGDVYTKKHIYVALNKKANMGINKHTEQSNLKINLSKNRPKFSMKDLGLSIKSDKGGLTYQANKTSSVDKSPNRSSNLISDGITEKLHNLKISRNTIIKQKQCCNNFNENYSESNCKCKTKIEAKDEIISVLNTKITNLQNKLRRMETLFKYSKSVDLKHNALSESIELPKKKSPMKKNSFSPAFVHTEVNNTKDKTNKYNINIRNKFKVPQLTGHTIERIKNYSVIPNRSKETKLKKYSLNLSGYNFKMMKPLVSTDNSNGKNATKNFRDKSLKNNLEYSYDFKHQKKPSLLNVPIVCTEILNDNDPDENIHKNDLISDNNKIFDGDDFSFHQEDTTKTSIQDQLALIKTRTQSIMNKLSMANKNLIRRVNSSSTLI